MSKMFFAVAIPFFVLVSLIGSIIIGSESSTTSQPIDQQVGYTISEVAQHNIQQDCWTIIDNEVYDLTTFIAEHPGGEMIIEACGVDATTAFQNQGLPTGQADEAREELNIPLGEAFHSPAARAMLDNLKIGALAE